MIEPTAPTWQEPITTIARRKWLRAASREKVVGPEVLEDLRRQRAERQTTTILSSDSDEEAAAP